MIDYAQLFADITSKEMAVGYFPGPRKWNASALRTLPCGCNYIATEYAATLPDAVSRCLESWESLECNGEGCEGGSISEKDTNQGGGDKNAVVTLKMQNRRLWETDPITDWGKAGD